MKPTHRKNRFLLLQTSAALALLVNQASADTFTWDGSDSSTWNLDANWVGGVAPASANTTDIIISGTANVELMYPGTVSYTIKSLTFDASNDADTKLSLQATGNHNANARNLTFSSDSGNATLTVESGSTGNKTIDRLTTGTGSAATIILTSSLDIIHNGSGTLKLGDAVKTSVTGGGDINKSGTGTLSLPGVNDYTGNTLVSGGKIVLGNALALQNSAYDTASVNGGLDITGFATPTLGGLTGSVDLSSTLITGYGSISTLTLNPQTGITNTYSGDVGNGNGSMALTKTGSGTQVLSGTNTYTGNTTVTLGTLLTTKVAALPGYNSSGKVIFNGGTVGVQVGGAGWTTGEVDTLLTNATKTNGALGIDTTNGNLTQWTAFTTTNLGSTLGLTKLGSNTLTLDQANSYSGATTVNGGKLTVASAGTINSTSGVSIGAGEFNYNSSTALTQAVSFAAGSTGGKLSGTGAINLGLNITAGNTLAIGNGVGSEIGAMAFGNNLEVGGTYLHELMGGGSTADLGDVAGNLTLGGILDLVQLGTYTAGNKFTLFAYDGTLTGLFKDSGGVTSILDDTNFTDAGEIWQINYNDTTAGLNGGVSASNTYVTITAVPEPNVAALIGGLGSILLLRRRR